METLSCEKISANSLALDILNPLRCADIYIFDQLDSTNAWLLQHKHCGVLCLAEAQSAGRGRQGKHWVSPATGNIYLSYCYCFDQLPKNFSLSTLAVGIAVCEALQALGLQGHGLKWPNDVYVNGTKLGGILLETTGDLQQVIIGIGLNIAMHPQTKIDQPWCCLNDVLSHTVDRNLLIALIIKHVQMQLTSLQQQEWALFKKQWRKWDILCNKTVSVLHGKENLQGKVMDIDAMGQLVVQFERGDLQYLNAAEIKIHC